MYSVAKGSVDEKKFLEGENGGKHFTKPDKYENRSFAAFGRLNPPSVSATPIRTSVRIF